MDDGLNPSLSTREDAQRQQDSIVRDLTRPGNVVIVNAVAGAGKTSKILPDVFKHWVSTADRRGKVFLVSSTHASLNAVKTAIPYEARTTYMPESMTMHSLARSLCIKLGLLATSASVISTGDYTVHIIENIQRPEEWLCYPLEDHQLFSFIAKAFNACRIR